MPWATAERRRGTESHRPQKRGSLHALVSDVRWVFQQDRTGSRRPWAFLSIPRVYPRPAPASYANSAQGHVINPALSNTCERKSQIGFVLSIRVWLACRGKRGRPGAFAFVPHASVAADASRGNSVARSLHHAPRQSAAESRGCPSHANPADPLFRCQRASRRTGPPSGSRASFHPSHRARWRARSRTEGRHSPEKQEGTLSDHRNCRCALRSIWRVKPPRMRRAGRAGW